MNTQSSPKNFSLRNIAVLSATLRNNKLTSYRCMLNSY